MLSRRVRPEPSIVSQIDSREPAEYLQFHVPVMRSRSTKGRTCFYRTKNQVTDPFPRAGLRYRPWHNAFDAAFGRQDGLVVSTWKQVLRSDAVLLFNAFNVHGIVQEAEPRQHQHIYRGWFRCRACQRGSTNRCSRSKRRLIQRGQPCHKNLPKRYRSGSMTEKSEQPQAHNF